MAVPDPAALRLAYDDALRVDVESRLPEGVAVERDGPRWRFTGFATGGAIGYRDLGGIEGDALDELIARQIRVFAERDEPFDAVVRPTLESARKAAERYREKTGARCNVLVSDDGLLCFAANDLEGALATARGTAPHARSVAQTELVTRMAYYEDADVGFVARPWPVRYFLIRVDA